MTHQPSQDQDLRTALAWYGEQARLARLIHSGGDPGRHALAEDGGKRAAAILAASPAQGPDKAGEREGLVPYLYRQWGWSKKTFGPALRTKGVIQHITKELREIEAKPHDLSEWVDVIILAMDGFWRHGGKPEDLLPAMQAKQDKNFARSWPDWRTIGEDRAIEHDRSGEALAPQPNGTEASRGVGYDDPGHPGHFSDAPEAGGPTEALASEDDEQTTERAMMRIEAEADAWIGETPDIGKMVKMIAHGWPPHLKDRAAAQADALVRQTFVEAFYRGFSAHKDHAAAMDATPTPPLSPDSTGPAGAYQPSVAAIVRAAMFADRDIQWMPFSQRVRAMEKASNEAAEQIAALTLSAPIAAPKWDCAARGSVGANDPQECNWPLCGCDPHAENVIAALQECDLLKSAPIAAPVRDDGIYWDEDPKHPKAVDPAIRGEVLTLRSMLDREDDANTERATLIDNTLGLGAAMRIAAAGFKVWADKPHNRKWARKIDGTPIPNDLPINIAQAFVDAGLILPTPAGAMPGEAQTQGGGR